MGHLLRAILHVRPHLPVRVRQINRRYGSLAGRVVRFGVQNPAGRHQLPRPLRPCGRRPSAARLRHRLARTTTSTASSRLAGRISAEPWATMAALAKRETSTDPLLAPPGSDATLPQPRARREDGCASIERHLGWAPPEVRPRRVAGSSGCRGVRLRVPLGAKAPRAASPRRRRDLRARGCGRVSARASRKASYHASSWRGIGPHRSGFAPSHRHRRRRREGAPEVSSRATLRTWEHGRLARDFRRQRSRSSTRTAARSAATPEDIERSWFGPVPIDDDPERLRNILRLPKRAERAGQAGAAIDRLDDRGRRIRSSSDTREFGGPRATPLHRDVRPRFDDLRATRLFAQTVLPAFHPPAMEGARRGVGPLGGGTPAERWIGASSPRRARSSPASSLSRSRGSVPDVPVGAAAFQQANSSNGWGNALRGRPWR